VPNFSKFQVSSYYDLNTLFYRVFWYTRKSLGIHFGYYDPDIKTHDDAILRVNKTLAEIAKIKAGEKVLDAGCGVGGSSIWLAKNLDARPTGITISETQINKAYHYAQMNAVLDKTKFIKRSFAETEFPDNSFDVVWAIESICHAESKSKVMNELFRVLKPGGRLIISDWFQSKNELNSDEKELLNEFIHGFAVPSIETPGSFKDILTKAGFKNIKQIDRGKDIKKNLEFGMPRTKRLTVPAKVLPKIFPKMKEVAMNYYGILACEKAYERHLWTIQTVYAEKH
jgi:cyclopropane fatty-acyl-phospholipid synthase-like methyltransferase